MQINQVKQMADKSVLTQPISGVLAEVYPVETTSHPQYGDGTKQNAKLTQGSDFIYVEFKDYPTDLMGIKGKSVTLSSSQSAHGLNGVKVNKYFSTKHQKELCNLRVTSTGKVTVGEPTYQDGQQVPPQAPPQSYQPAPTTSTPQNTTQAMPSAGATGGPKKTIHGATVGMAINNAVTYMANSGEQFDAKRLYVLASEIVRVSQHIEAGNLSPKPNLELNLSNPDETVRQVVQHQMVSNPPPAQYDPHNSMHPADDIPFDDDQPPF